MRGAVIALVVVVGCKYDPASIDPGGGGDDAQPPGDGDIDGPPTTCSTAGETACNGRTQLTCGSDGKFDPALDKVCDYTCMGGHCVDASNLPVQAVASCPAATTKRIKLAANGTAIVTGTGITCSPNCGDGSVLAIAPIATLTNVTPNLAIYCLTELDLPANSVTFTPGDVAVAVFVSGAVTIAANISLDGAAAPGGSQGGSGGLGGFAGGDRSSGVGVAGSGPCAGQGGDYQNIGGATGEAGGGGGGGGHATAGGTGGVGSDGLNLLGASGGTGGTICGLDTLLPLSGGSGGGGGGKGNTSNSGLAGGGGGGVIQVTSRTSITITGALHARGGAGDGDITGQGGGGGGGAGGAFLFEAPSITISGSIDVTGGDGGASAAGAGGAGGGATPGTGTDAALVSQGGSGGGGASGRIRLNAPNASCTVATPQTACTTGLPPPAL